MVRLSRGLRGLGDECLVAGRDESPWREVCSKEGLPFASIPFGGDLSPRSWMALGRILRSWKPEVVIAKGFRQARWTRWADGTVAIGVKLPSQAQLDASFWNRFTFRRVLDRVLVDSFAVRDQFRRLPWATPSKIVAVHNGVDDLGPWPDPARRARVRADLGGFDEAVPVVAVVGRFSEGKRLPDALNAFARADAARTARLVILGDGPGREGLQDLAAGLGIVDRVHFAGWRDAAAELLRGTDVLLHASDEEGLPNAVLEAMAAGAAVVATRAGGTAEAVEEGVTGLTVACGDVAGLSASLARLLGDRALRERMGAAGAARVRSAFTIPAMAGAIRDVMARVARHRRLGRCPPRAFCGGWSAAGEDDVCASVRDFVAHGAGRADPVKATPRVMVERRARDGGHLYAKWFLASAPRDRWGSGLRPVRALHNYRVAHRLAAMGFDVVPHLLAAWRRRGLLAMDSLLVTADVPGAVPFDEWGGRHAGDPRALRAAAMSAGRWLADLHEAGIVPHDLKASNLLRAPDGRMILLDLDNCSVSGRPVLRAVVRNLAQFCRSFDEVAGLREWHAFVAAYGHRRAWPRDRLRLALRRVQARRLRTGRLACVRNDGEGPPGAISARLIAHQPDGERRNDGDRGG